MIQFHVQMRFKKSGFNLQRNKERAKVKGEINLPLNNKGIKVEELIFSKNFNIFDGYLYLARWLS
jgi:hypothetical protein